MKISIKINPQISEPVVQIETAEITDEVKRIRQLIQELDSTGMPSQIIGYQEGLAKPIPLNQIIRIYSDQKQVWVQISTGIWRIRQRLKEIELLLPAKYFIRINQGEIVNIHSIESMDLSLAGSIGLKLIDGTKCFVARRSLKEFKQKFGF